MIGIVWPLEPAESSAAAKVVYSDSVVDSPVSRFCVDELRAAREAVGLFRAKHGEDAWRTLIDSNAETRAPHAVRPVSRAYNKLRQIHELCALQVPRRALFLCEAPGGFVQFYTETNRKMQWVATSLGKHIPFAKAIRLTSHGCILDDLAENGDIRKETVRRQIEAYKGAGFDLVTADGAYNNDADHANLEENSVLLFAAQLECAMCCQADKGTLVIKFFVGSLHCMQSLIQFAIGHYEHSMVVKPKDSRSVNDERYLVCTGFRAALFHGPFLHAEKDILTFGIDQLVSQTTTSVLARMMQLQISNINAALSQVNPHKRFKK